MLNSLVHVSLVCMDLHSLISLLFTLTVTFPFPLLVVTVLFICCRFADGGKDFGNRHL